MRVSPYRITAASVPPSARIRGSARRTPPRDSSRSPRRTRPCAQRPSGPNCAAGSASRRLDGHRGRQGSPRIRAVDHDRHVRVVLGCRPDHRRAADVDVLDARVAGPSGCNRGFERIEVSRPGGRSPGCRARASRPGASGLERTRQEAAMDAGWSVFTRPSIISGNPVRLPSRTGTPASESAARAARRDELDAASVEGGRSPGAPFYRTRRGGRGSRAGSLGIGRSSPGMRRDIMNDRPTEPSRTRPAPRRRGSTADRSRLRQSSSGVFSLSRAALSEGRASARNAIAGSASRRPDRENDLLGPARAVRRRKEHAVLELGLAVIDLELPGLPIGEHEHHRSARPGRGWA